MKDSKTEALSLQQFATDFHKETSQKLREMKSRHMKELKILYRLRRAKWDKVNLACENKRKFEALFLQNLNLYCTAKI